MEEGSSLGTEQRYQPAQTYSPSPKKGNRIFFIIVSLLIIGLIIFGATRLLGSRNKAPEEKPTPTPTAAVSPTDTPTPEESPTPEPSKTPTPKPTTNPIDSATGLDRSKLSVEVQNGSGEVGVASRASDFLKSLGYRVVTIGNADNFGYENVVISVKSDSSTYLSLLKSDLAKQYTVGSTSASLSASSSADALVIIGK